MIPFTRLKTHERKCLRDVIPLPKPFTLIMEPTSLCNFQCVQCFQSVSRGSWFHRIRGHMPMDCYKEVVAQMRSWAGPRLKVLKLSLYGEPLLHPDFPEMLRIARESDIAERIETTTNASVLSAELAGAMVEQQLDYVRVSVYSARPERHAHVTRSPLPFGAIHENLARLQRIKKERGSERPFVSVKMLDSYGEENALFFDAYRDVADELYLDKPHNWSGVSDDRFLEGLYGDEVGKARQDITASSSSRIACTLPFFTLAVRSTGDVSPCCVDWAGGTNLGNIRTESLESIWGGERLYLFRKMQLEDRKHENAACARCELFRSDYYTRDNVDGLPVERIRPQVAGKTR